MVSITQMLQLRSRGWKEHIIKLKDVSIISKTFPLEPYCPKVVLCANIGIITESTIFNTYNTIVNALR